MDCILDKEGCFYPVEQVAWDELNLDRDGFNLSLDLSSYGYWVNRYG